MTANPPCNRSRALHRRIGVLIACLMVMAICLPAPGLAQTVVLVRHAEKADAPRDDPALNEAGQRRAQALADALGGAGVTAIFATQARRTQETAAPLAKRVGVSAEVLAIARGGMAEHVALAARRLREKPEGVVVLVGHSNTVPAIAEALGVSVPPIPECEYSRLIILVPGAASRAIQARYGEADGPCR